MPTMPKLKRRRFQYGIRTLLIVMAVCGVAARWVSLRLDKARRQAEVVLAIEVAGGEVDYDEKSTVSFWMSRCGGPNFGKPVIGIWFGRYVEATDARLAPLEKFSELRYLLCNGKEITDAGLQRLKSLTNLERLEISGSQISDAGLNNLTGLAKLKCLDLDGSQITDGGVEHFIGRIANLNDLNPAGTQITNASLQFVARLTDLQSLGLMGTPISDDGLEQLKSLTKLRDLWIDRTRVSRNGVKSLKKALPNCEIHFTGWPFGSEAFAE